MINFFWLMYLGIMGTTAIWYLIKGKYKTGVTRLDFFISIITWLGLFGFVTGTEMLSPVIWKIVFILGLLWDVVFTIFIGDRVAGDFGLGDEEELPLAAKLVGLIFLFPLYYGIYQYAF